MRIDVVLFTASAVFTGSAILWVLVSPETLAQLVGV